MLAFHCCAVISIIIRMLMVSPYSPQCCMEMVSAGINELDERERG